MLDTILQENFAHALTQKELLPRFYALKPSKLLLYGSAKVGKSMCALALARDFKHPVYVDGNDTRLEINYLKEILLTLHLENKMDILIAKHCPSDLFLPPLEHIILIQFTPTPIPQGFSAQKILPLNFAEYVCAYKKESRSTLFARFLKEGNCPATLHLNPFQKIHRKQEIYKLFLGTQFPLFKALLRFQALNVTTHHLYIQLKKTLKLSKDTFYALMRFLQESQSIFLIPHCRAPSKPRKLYFSDFSLPYALTPTHHLPCVFENMVALELIRYFEHLYCQHPFLVVHSSTITFYFLALAFPTLENLEYKLKNLLKYNPPQQLFIITINFEKQGKIGTCTYHACSFSTFVLEILPTL
ncbi:ATP-binding protein [Helicobacter baculiformis]|uniref:ATP-binding protein n=1 Tax=Helicobacter baculiformis TaxID=427351 RepID=A0ABV7ZEL0_9HELI|nr:ATP-binding protein [Helicobacter baculiformis]